MLLIRISPDVFCTLYNLPSECSNSSGLTYLGLTDNGL